VSHPDAINTSPKTTTIIDVRDLLIYVGVPFCPSKCHFCAWVSAVPTKDLRQRPGEPLRRAYIDAVERQILDKGSELTAAGYVPRLMYWGGGTASSLTIAEFRSIMTALRTQFDLSQLAEATMECSPDTLTPERLDAYRAGGFDRVSIGVQSFDGRTLKEQGRSHTPEQALEAVGHAADAGFTQLNIDLMCGLPNESLADFEASAQLAASLPVSHISLYPFFPIRQTVMYRQIARGTARLDRRERLAAYELGRKLFTDAGLPEYALSYFGQEPCRADLAYYRMEMDWVGFGPGANSVLNGGFARTHRVLSEYVDDPMGFDRRAPAAMVADLFLGQSLLLFEGIVASRWEERMRQPLDKILSDKRIADRLEQITRGTELIRDEQGIRLPRDRMTDVFYGPRTT
jgi:coproporphyrinogen III oxidase-like Fe-S oxidoreductase